jgi:hypothetical protein
MGRAPDRLGPLQLAGAWLGLWTPPRGVEVPPPPWRAIAAGGAALVLVLAVAAAIVVPRMAGDREAARERERRAEAARHAEFLAGVDREQAPRRGRGRADPAGGAPSARRVAARRGLLAAAETGIARDAREREPKPIRGVQCTPFPATLGAEHPAEDLSRRSATFNCVAITSRFGSGDQAGGEGVIGMPFRLLADFPRGRYAFCRIVPLGDQDRLTHPLPRACRRP